MFKLHVQGLCLCVFDTRRHRLRICCLNSGLNEALGIPVHLQTLVAPTAAVKSFTATPLRSMTGRLRAPFTDGSAVGWDLTERQVSMTNGAGLPTKHAEDLPDRHPDPAAPDWTPLHWVMPISRYLPGSTVKPATLEIGAMTTAIVDVTGAKAFGGAPETLRRDSTFTFWFNNGVDQAVTDTMILEFDNVPDVRVADVNGRKLGEIVFADGTEAWLINEATDRDIQNEKAADSDRHGQHLAGYFQVLDKVPANQVLPVRLMQWQRFPGVVDGTFCIVLRADI
jgi:hypothetical protein